MAIQTVDQYRELIEHSSDIITLVDQAGVIQFESPSVKDVLGYDPEELVGENAFEYIHPDDRERVLETFDSVVGSPGSVTDRADYRFRHADGSWVWLESITTNKVDSALDGYVINSRDIRQRKQREQDLTEERDKYSTLVNHVHDGITILQDGEFVFANQRCLEILGYTETELIGKPFLEVVAPEDRDRVQARYKRRLDPDTEDPPARYEAQFRTRDGDQRVAEVSAAKFSYDGESADLVALRDVTERKHYETQLEERTAELEALNRVIRHDIRNDMTIILGWARLLEDHVDTEGEEYLQKVLNSGEHIVELTEIARDYVETVTKETDLEVEPTSLRSILETELALRREAHPAAEFVSPEAIPDIEVIANDLLGSVFRNLLNNAVQHNDGDEPIVEITCDEHEEDVVVRIADNGPGIPDDQKESVFGKGEKGLDSPGTGIGLYLVQTLIDQYDGKVWIEDNDPTGTIFNVQLRKAKTE